MIRYLDEFRGRRTAAALLQRIHEGMPKRKIALMEICGGHTLTAVKYGLPDLLPKGLVLKSGPGCPVCVTPSDYIDRAIALAARLGLTIASFGDMIRVPGSKSSLREAKAAGADIRICLSPLEAVRLAALEPRRQVIFLGIGFETTAPTIAASVTAAAEQGLENFSVLSALKTMPAAMRALLASPEIGIDGFICPGHVTAVAGSRMYEPIAEEFRMPCVVSGFEPSDMLASILMLVEQVKREEGRVEIQYTRVVNREGNETARRVMEEVFEPVSASWRGLGAIESSGLGFREKYRRFDAAERFAVEIPATIENPDCLCGDVMRGLKKPSACRLFAKTCRPDHPVGACMVSAEGACGIFYRWGRKKS